MKKRENRQPAQITIFVSAVLLIILALLCTSLESARISAMRYYIKSASESAVYSLFSEYQKEMFEKYHLFFLENRGGMEESLTDYLSYYENADKDLSMSSSHFFRFKTQSVQSFDVVYVTDLNGLPLETEILEYSKYSMTEALLDLVKDKLDVGYQAVRLMDLLNRFSPVTDQIMDLESQYTKLRSQAEEIKEKADNTGTEINNIISGLEKVSDIKHHLGELEAEAGNAEGLEQASLTAGIVRTRQELSDAESRLSTSVDRAEQGEAKLSVLLRQSETEICQLLLDTETVSEEIEPFLSELDELEWQLTDELQEAARSQKHAVFDYTEDSGQRKMAAEQMGDGISRLEEILNEEKGLSKIVNSDEDLSEKISSLKTLAGNLTEESDNLWNDNVETAAETGEKNLLSAVKEWKNKGILSLVTDSNVKFSERDAAGGNLPSKQNEMACADDETDIQGILEMLYENMCLNEYLLKTMPSYVDRDDGSGYYDLEYVLGKSSDDKSNLTETVEKLLLLREGMNLIHLVGSKEKMASAQAAATALVGVTGILPLVELVKWILLAAWAFIEAIADVKTLLAGGRVPFLKSADEWKTSLDLSSFTEVMTDQVLLQSSDNGNGMDYKEYIRLLLCLTQKEKKLFRCMDMIQWNIQQTDSDFYIDHCVYQADFQISVEADRLFVTLPLMSSGGTFSGRYQFSTKIQRSYLESFSK